MEMGNAVAIIKGEGKSMRRKEKKARIEQIRASLGLSDSQRTPVVLSSPCFYFCYSKCSNMSEECFYIWHTISLVGVVTSR